MSLKIGPYKLTKGALLPYDEKSSTTQKESIDGNGGVVVHERSYKEKFIRAKCKCSVAEARTLEGYLTNGVRYKAIAFELVDGFGTTRLVRFWDKDVHRKHLGGDRVELDLLFREEVAP